MHLVSKRFWPTLRLTLPILTVFCACRSGGTLAVPSERPEGPAAASTAATSIRLEHVVDRDAWRLTYVLARPVQTLRFVRPHAPYRASRWQITTPGLRFAHTGDEDVVVAEDARAFAELGIDIPTYAIKPEKDYQVFIPYSDASTLVYTGHFDVRDDGADAQANVFTFVPRKDERLVLRGEVSSGTHSWQSEGEGTYVYFGSTQPTAGDGFIGVVDAGMPAWLRTPMQTLLPTLFGLYASRIGLPLTFHPTVFMSYGDQPNGFSFGGGTLPGLVQLEVRLGPEHRNELDDSVRQRADYLVAHEAAHLWNEQLSHHDTPIAEWLNEGGPDALAYAALQSLGRLSHSRLREIEGEAFANCLVGTRLGPVHEASVPGRFKLHYWCGHLIVHLTQVLASRATPSVDLFQFWGELLRDAHATESSEERYLNRLRALPDGAAAERAVRALLTASTLDPVSTWLALDTSLMPAPTSRALPASYQQLSGLVAATLLLRNACGRDVTPLAEAGGLRVQGGCGALGDDFILLNLEGHELHAAGASAYDAALAACASHGTLKAGIRQGPTPTSPIVQHVLACPNPFPARPAYVEIAE